MINIEEIENKILSLVYQEEWNEYDLRTILIEGINEEILSMKEDLRKEIDWTEYDAWYHNKNVWDVYSNYQFYESFDKIFWVK